MIKQFAKLFDTPNGQLLAFLKVGDEGKYDLVVMGEPMSDIHPQLSFGYDSDEAAIQVFNTMDQMKADQTASQMRSTAAMILRDNIK
jgi:hypothetical protein